MTDWVKLARTTIAERRKIGQEDQETKSQNEKIEEINKEKAEVKLEEKYSRSKWSKFF